MAIQDGNPVNAAYTNSQVVNNDQDETITGVVTLDHDNAVSGSTILDLQKCINDLKALLLFTQGITNPAGLVTIGSIDQSLAGRITLEQGLYFDEPDTDGTWRVRQDGADLVYEVRVAGTYEERNRYEA